MTADRATPPDRTNAPNNPLEIKPKSNQINRLFVHDLPADVKAATPKQNRSPRDKMSRGRGATYTSVAFDTAAAKVGATKLEGCPPSAGCVDDIAATTPPSSLWGFR
jgi:hypothetical protein